MPPSLRAVSVEEGFVKGSFQDARDSEGDIPGLSDEDEQNILAGLPVVEV